LNPRLHDLRQEFLQLSHPWLESRVLRRMAVGANQCLNLFVVVLKGFQLGVEGMDSSESSLQLGQPRPGFLNGKMLFVQHEGPVFRYSGIQVLRQITFTSNQRRRGAATAPYRSFAV